MTKKTDALKDLVFEIGCEELPATNLADLFETSAAEGVENPLKAKWKKVFEDNRVAFESAEVWATPRRLVFFLKGVAASQTPRDQFTKLMAEAEGYPGGQPSEKLLTILKHRNVSLAETVIQDLNGKPHVFIKKAEPVRKTASVLPEILEAFVPALGFPKNMKWDASGVYFPRPIRSLLCFLGDQSIKFKVADVRSGDKVFVFTKSKRASFTVTGPESYFKVLKAQGIVLDQAERKKLIQASLEKAAKASHSRLYDDPFLLNEVNYLVENPQILAAPFDKEFLRLPFPVLTVSMARKQRIFGLVDEKDWVLPRFLAIADGKISEKERKLISENYEHVLHAKLQDSLFFFQEDLKAPLEKRREELKNLVFLKGAGSMLDKSSRLAAIAKKLGPSFGLDTTAQMTFERACLLSKSDLLTQMVGEFPELQGVIGRYYAQAGGENEKVAIAIAEQYLPRTVNDKLPETPVGGLVSILDKVDLISACFLLGLEPTSSLDPYALRRSASAVAKITLEKRLSYSFSALVRETRDALLATVKVTDEQKQKASTARIEAFFRERFKALLVDRGFRDDLVASVLSSECDDLYAAYQRLQALSAIAAQPAFAQACKVVERTTNILKGNKEALDGRIDPALFEKDEERKVFESYQVKEAGIRQAKAERDFARATSLYAGAFFDILNEFFDKVFINAEDLNVRRNRLTLLRSVKELYTRDIADLSKMQPTAAVREPATKGRI